LKSLEDKYGRKGGRDGAVSEVSAARVEHLGSEVVVCQSEQYEQTCAAQEALISQVSAKNRHSSIEWAHGSRNGKSGLSRIPQIHAASLMESTTSNLP
jgi:hypothetical protein